MNINLSVRSNISKIGRGNYDGRRGIGRPECIYIKATNIFPCFTPSKRKYSETQE